MSHTKTGANRLKGGLAPGWVLNHKTGTGQVLGPSRPGITTSASSPRPTAGAMRSQ